MSLSYKPLQTVKVQTPITTLNHTRRYAILEGGSMFTVKDYSTTSYSDSNFIFSCPPPNPSILVSRHVRLQVPVQFTITGTCPIGQRLLVSGCDAPRAFPLSSVMTSLIVTINTTSVSINMSDVIQPLLRFENYQRDREFEYSISPSMMDQNTTYEEGFGTIRNPLGKYGDCYEMARGAYPIITINNPVGLGPLVPVTATVSLLLTEDIFLSPFLFGKCEHSGLIGIQTLDFNFNFGNLGYMWSHSNSGGSTLTSIVGHFTSNPTLLFNYVTPRILMPLHNTYVWPYYEIQRYPTAFGSVASGASVQIQSQNIQINSIPKRIYLFVRRQNSDQTFNTTDTYFRINQVQVNFDNLTNLLASATELDLYNISRENGLSLSWEQWHGSTNTYDTTADGQTISTVGSIACLVFAKDIPLNEVQCPGLLGTYQLQVNINVTNTCPNAITPTFYIVTVSEGTFTITNNRSIVEIGVMTKKDVLDSRESPFVDYHMLKNAYGGDFLDDISKFGNILWSGIKGVVSDIGHAVPEALRLANESIPNAASLASKAAPFLGFGDGGELIDGGYDYGGATVGGRMIRRRDLRKKLRY